MFIAAQYFWSVQWCIIQAPDYQNTPIVQSVFSKYAQENQEICFYHHHQGSLIYCFGWNQIPLLMHLIQQNPG